MLEGVMQRIEEWRANLEDEEAHALTVEAVARIVVAKTLLTLAMDEIKKVIELEAEAAWRT